MGSGRAKLAAKRAKKAGKDDVDESSHEARLHGSISAKKKQKVTKKIKFLERVQKSAGAAVQKKTKKKRSNALNDLAGLSKALEELAPQIHDTVAKDGKAAHRTKYKKSGARQRLQEQEQERLAAIYMTPNFQADPIAAVHGFLQRTLEPAQTDQKRKSKTTVEKAGQKKRQQT